MFRPWAARTAVMTRMGMPRYYHWSTRWPEPQDIGNVIVRIWSQILPGQIEESLSYSCPLPNADAQPNIEWLLIKTLGPRYRVDPSDVGYIGGDGNPNLLCTNPHSPLDDGFPPFVWEFGVGLDGFLLAFKCRGSSSLWPPIESKPCKLFDALVYEWEGERQVIVQPVSATITLA